MDEDKLSWIKRAVDPTIESSFDIILARVMSSIFALACGKWKDGSLNIIGTGFSLGNSPSERNSTLIATCSHVANEVYRIRNLKKKEGVKEGLIDNYCRIAHLEEGKIVLRELEGFAISQTGSDGMSYEEKHDVCICEIPNINIQGLPLFAGNYRFGSDVVIAGFPLYDRLQLGSIQPFILKTFISSVLLYPIDAGDKESVTARLALGCIVGEGFSGSPVFSIGNGQVVGMVDRVPLETEIETIKMKKPNPIEFDHPLKYPAGVSLAVPSTHIKRLLDLAIDHEKKS